MSRKLDEKTAGINLSGYKPRAKVIDGQTPGSDNPTEAGTTGGRSHTGVGLVMGAIAGKDEVSKKLADATSELVAANERLTAFEGATVARPLDPKLIRRSRWANRNAAEWATDDFQNFKSELKTAGGNVQPIKVRVIPGVVFDGQTPAYEIVYGHRRHWACLELGLMVTAIVVDDMSDKALFTEMDRENRGRKNLSAWEQGCMYSDALKEGLYPSIRQLAEANSVNVSDAARWIQLAKLSIDVVEAFPSPLDLQVRWAKPLTDALQRAPDDVLIIARELKGKRGSLGATEVFEKLIGKSAKAKDSEIAINSAGKKMASFRLDAKGRAVIEFEAGALQESRHKALAKLIEDFLSRND